MGYTGGTTPDPIYRRLGDHTETVQVDFDAATVGYGELLELFWRSHNASRPGWSRQYMSAVFYADQQQQQVARDVKEHLEKPVEGSCAPNTSRFPLLSGGGLSPEVHPPGRPPP